MVLTTQWLPMNHLISQSGIQYSPYTQVCVIVLWLHIYELYFISIYFVVLFWGIPLTTIEQGSRTVSYTQQMLKNLKHDTMLHTNNVWSTETQVKSLYLLNKKKKTKKKRVTEKKNKFYKLHIDLGKRSL